MKRALLYIFMPLSLLSAYSLGLVSFKYNLFPVNDLRLIWIEAKSIYNNTTSQLTTSGDTYDFDVTRLSYYQINESGGLVVDKNRSAKNSVFYAVGDDLYTFTGEFSASNTAIVIMDAWADSGTAFLNEQYSPVYYQSILPLVESFAANGFTQFAFTNVDGVLGYGEELFPELEEMIDDGKILKRYHEMGDVEPFEYELNAMGIRNIIYLGFASNMCIIGRRVGMFGMYQRGFKVFFVPESSAAIETGTGWSTGEFHSFTTSLIRFNFQGSISQASILEAFEK
jgi:hypothetical protein